MYIDGVLVSAAMGGYLVRRAPGHVHYDYGQTLTFELQPHGGAPSHGDTAVATHSTADPPLPRGCIQLYTYSIKRCAAILVPALFFVRLKK